MRGRLREYPWLHGRAGRESEKLGALRNDTLDLVRAAATYTDERDERPAVDKLEGLKGGVFALGIEALSEVAFRIEGATTDRGKLVVALGDVEASLRRGDTLIVVDTEDLLSMGTFMVTEKRDGECYAVGGKDVDKLLLGLVMERGEIKMVPHKTAILVKRSADNDRE